MPEDEELSGREKAKVPAKKYPLGGGTVTYKVGTGESAVTEEFEEVPHCWVGKEPIKDDNYHLCTTCEKPVCPDHAIIYEDRPYCQEHASLASNIVKLQSLALKDAQVLVCLHNRIFGIGDISRLARVTEDDVLVSLSKLASSGYIRREKVMLFFKIYELTSDGMEAMPLLYAMHKQKNAMKQFIVETTAWLQRKDRIFSLPEIEAKKVGES